MNTSETISIVTVCDNHFVSMLAALLKSIEITHVSGEKVDIYIVADGISKNNKSKLIDSLTTGKLNLIWMTMDEAIPKDLKLPADNTTFPMSVYVRICIPYFIPQDATRVIFLDVDMILLEDISKLWHTDIGDYAIAAAIDRAGTVDSPWGGILNYKELGFDPKSKYFNAGMQIIKPKLWRELDIPKKIFKCAEDNFAYLNFADQYCLNVVFNANWFELSPLWNCHTANDIKSPYLIHFIGIKPIYQGYNLNKDYKDLFFYYLNQTKWAGMKPQSDSIRMIKKAYNKFVKKLPALFR